MYISGNSKSSQVGIETSPVYLYQMATKEKIRGGKCWRRHGGEKEYSLSEYELS